MNVRTGFLVVACLLRIAAAADRYEAENAIVEEHSVEKVADTKASGGYYVNMKEGVLSFSVTQSAAGFFTLWATYSQPNDSNGKIQNLSINGSSTGQIAFPYTTQFVTIKASSKIKLAAGLNKINITKSWGWVHLDYIELTPFIETPFSIAGSLVTPNASENARKMYDFLKNNFTKKNISGVMTNTVMLNDGKYTPNTVETQTEVAWIINASGKTPALLGLDFMHAAGLKSENEWYAGYTKATVALAEDIFKKGGFPAYCWHWRDPGHTGESFYSPSSGSPATDFNLKEAFIDSVTCQTFDTNSAAYKGIIRDLDIVAGYLKILSDKGVPVLWRPLHEASGKWFWWGYKGAKACKALYLLMFDRFINHHGLNNLIWVWTTDEAPDALDWYPGDAYVDILGRDYYYYPREANHGSLVASFERLKEIFEGKKIIALTENGSVPSPDSLEVDGAAWSYFMPWYGDYTMDGWAHDNTAADWNHLMNHDYVITLDEMPGWDNYQIPIKQQKPKKIETSRIAYSPGFVTVTGRLKNGVVELFDSRGARIAVLNQCTTAGNARRFTLPSLSGGIYLVRAKSGTNAGIKQILVGQ